MMLRPGSYSQHRGPKKAFKGRQKGVRAYGVVIGKPCQRLKRSFEAARGGRGDQVFMAEKTL